MFETNIANSIFAISQTCSKTEIEGGEEGEGDVERHIEKVQQYSH
jgi:hypothetical protein